MASMVNQMTMIGPNILPMDMVPNCCIKNSSVMITSTILTMVQVPRSLNTGGCAKPSTAR